MEVHHARCDLVCAIACLRSDCTWDSNGFMKHVAHSSSVKHPFSAGLQWYEPIQQGQLEHGTEFNGDGISFICRLLPAKILAA